MKRGGASEKGTRLGLAALRFLQPPIASRHLVCRRPSDFAIVDSQVAKVSRAGVSVLGGYGDAAASAACFNPAYSLSRQLDKALRFGTRPFGADRSITRGRSLGQPLEGQESQGYCLPSVQSRRCRPRCARGTRKCARPVEPD